MQITQTKKEDLKRAYTVTMTATEVDAKINEKLQEIGKTANLPGFRPGKVPMALLKSKYKQAVMGEVLESAVNDSMLQAINENELRPAMRPKIEVKSFDEKTGLEYSMEIELLPEIKIADLKKIKVEQLTAKPEKKTITETLERIASSNKTSEKVEENRAAKKGDIVVIDFDGSVNGERQPGMKGEAFPLELGSKSFIDTFEDQLIGAKVGDHKTVKVTFPENYGKADLQGAKAVFEVDVKELRAPVAAKIDEEFAKAMGFDNLAKLEEVIEQQIQKEYDQVARLNTKRQLLDALDEAHNFTIPAGMAEQEYQSIMHQLAHENDPNHVHGPDCDHGTTEENAEYRAIANRRVKLGLVLAEIGRINKVEVTNQELQQAVIAEARRYPGQEKQVFEFYQKNPQALEGLKAPLYEEKVVDFVLETVNIEKRQVGIEELTKAAEQESPATAKASKSAGEKKKSGK